jgi:hypothetical protein
VVAAAVVEAPAVTVPVAEGAAVTATLAVAGVLVPPALVAVSETV